MLVQSLLYHVVTICAYCPVIGDWAPQEPESVFVHVCIPGT